MVLYRAHTGFDLSNAEKIALIVASLAIAHVSWRFIEQPFRNGRLKSIGVPAWAGCVVFASGVCATVLALTGGLPARYPESVRKFAAFDYQQGPAYREGSCFISRAFSHNPRIAEHCLAIDPGRRNYLIVGDSHAAHYWAGFQEIYPEINFLQATASGCKPTIVGKGAPRCRAVIDHVFGAFVPAAGLDAIIISAHWSHADLPLLQKTVEALRAHAPKVIVMGPIMTYDDFVPRLLARAEATGNPDLLRQARNRYPVAVDGAFQKAFADSDYVRYVPVIDLLCGGTYDCRTLDAAGFPLQFDRAHLTAGGAAEVAKLMRAHGRWLDPGLRPSPRTPDRERLLFP